MINDEYLNYNDLREKILVLNFAEDDNEIIRNPKLSVSVLEGIRRQFNLSTLHEALGKHLDMMFKDFVSPKVYESFCNFMMKNSCEESLKFIPDENLRVKYMKRISDPSKKAEVLTSISDDDTKIEYLKSFRREADKVKVICSLSSDEKKLKLLPKIQDFHKQALIIASLESDEKKLEYIYSGHLHPSVISDIAVTMKDDRMKAELISLIPSDTARFRVLVSIKDTELKKSLYEEEIRSEEVKKRKYPDFVLSLPIEEQLQNFYKFNDNIKFLILRECDLDTRIKLIPEIETEHHKRDLLALFSAEELDRYLDSRFSNTQNFWVRTDSEEKEANLPRDDRQAIVEEVIRYSSVPDQVKISFIHKHIKDKEKIKELLQLFDYETVIEEYFQIKDDAVDVRMLDYINQSYNIYDLSGVRVSIVPGFDFDKDENRELLTRVRDMLYPEIVLSGISYDEYRKCCDFFDGSDALLFIKDVEVDTSMDLDLLNDMKDVAQLFVVNGRFVKPSSYCTAKELIFEAFPGSEDEKLESVRGKLEFALSSGQIGYTLIEAKKIFEEAGFSEEETKQYGGTLFKTLHNRDIEKYPNLYLALNEESVEVFHEWDETHSVLANDFSTLVCDLTKNGIKRAAEILVNEGYVSQDFGISYMLDYLGEHRIPEEGIEYGKRIVGELLKEQNLSVEDIKTLNPGAFADVFLVGDFVVKLGSTRETKELPVHDRILPSILRFQVDSKNNSNEVGSGGVSSFIEVQPYVNLMNLEARSVFGDGQPETFDVFADLRANNIFWGDVAKRNLGFADKSPQVSDTLFTELKRELRENVAVRIYHDDGAYKGVRVSDSNDPYYFVIDTDFLYSVDDNVDISKLRVPSIISSEFENKYMDLLQTRRKSLENREPKSGKIRTHGDVR